MQKFTQYYAEKQLLKSLQEYAIKRNIILKRSTIIYRDGEPLIERNNKFLNMKELYESKK
ncbi:hypothetical protein pb186bvf_008357 [Paramecium bursaria]